MRFDLFPLCNPALISDFFDDPPTPPIPCHRRSFKSTSKGLVRNWESFKSMDTTTFMSAGSVRVYRKSELIGRSESVESSDSSVGGSSVAESYYRLES